MNRNFFVIVCGFAAVGVSNPATAYHFKDHTNTYFTSNNPNVMVLTGTQQKSADMVVIERTSPVLIEKVNAAPVLIEDRIVKRHHAFKLGIWPLFDFEIK